MIDKSSLSDVKAKGAFVVTQAITATLCTLKIEINCRYFDTLFSSSTGKNSLVSGE